MTDKRRSEQRGKPNRLAQETSPYLLQHAHNPVDWYPWGPEALQRARTEQKPIFLSIGYSACHWCHVMEHESFEDPEIGRLLSENFVSIKVDREERPDLDQIYMNAVQILSGRGGWPMSVFLTPDLEPFFGGTYWPPDDRYGMPGFRRVLEGVVDAWKNRRDEVDKAGEQLTGSLRQLELVAPSEEKKLSDSLVSAAVRTLERSFDSTHGGFGAAPKFPHAADLKLLLRQWKRTGSRQAPHMVGLTLDKMAAGGIYDHLGGGFHRYSVDARWLVPHFEKMLYDNALLVQVYLEAFQATGSDDYARVARETLDYVLREMTAPEGGFYSTQDADSEGVEGKFFVWSLKEVKDVLGDDAAEKFGYVYDVTEPGNWEGRNILNRHKTLEQDARLLKIDQGELEKLLADARAKLLEVRSRRVAPARDEKVLVAWNGMMIEAMALAAQVLDEPRYAEAAARAAGFLLGNLRQPDGRLLHTYKDGQAKLNAYLDDYAYLMSGLLVLYEADFDARWLEAALELAGVLIERFWDPERGGFYYTGKDHEPLLTRSKDVFDGATPSGNSMAATALLRLAKLTGDDALLAKAEGALRLVAGPLARSPGAAGQALVALDFYLGPTQERAVVADPASGDGAAVLRVIRRCFLPNKVVALVPPGGAVPAPLAAMFEGKSAQDGQPTVYICENFACQAPLVGSEALAKALDEKEAGAGSD